MSTPLVTPLMYSKASLRRGACVCEEARRSAWPGRTATAPHPSAITHQLKRSLPHATTASLP
eukprot:363930-Chlamydomonas_euryale.AAC.2